MGHLFQSSEEFPFHISVGAVLTDEKGDICCHFFEGNEMLASRGITGSVHILMRETLEPGETLEMALARGIREEFGATGTVRGFLGSIKSNFPRKSGTVVEKTTLYFLVEKTDMDLALRKKDDVEATSEIRWIKPNSLLTIFEEQGKRFKRTDLDESEVIKKYLMYGARRP